MPQRFLEKTFLSKIGILEKDRLEDLLLTVKNKFEAEPKLLRIKQGKVLFAGDIHGDFEITQNIIKLYHETACNQLVFLGDYIDRGEEEMDNINFLFHLKIEFPDTIFMLRGNHETSRINSTYGFYDRVLRHYGPFGREVYALYNYVFSKMPLAGMTWNGIFFAHAGIPENLDGVDIIDQIEDEIDPQDSRTFELLWNDPLEGISGFRRNTRGPHAKFFGEDAFVSFLERNHFHMMIRSHEHYAMGYQYLFDHRLLGIYTSRTYYRRHRPKVAILSSDGTLAIQDV